jgi:hypothetical protein
MIPTAVELRAELTLIIDLQLDQQHIPLVQLRCIFLPKCRGSCGPHDFRPGLSSRNR